MNSSLAEILRRADVLYDAREQLENVSVSVELLQKDECANDYDAMWRMGRALFFLGQESERDEKSVAYHTRGASICERATRLQPSRVEGHFWLGVNLALLARLENSFKALSHALRAQHSLKRAVRLDSSYHAAGPLRVLARLQHKLPRLFGGGMKRSLANFERAISLAPANTVTRIYFAEMLLEMGDTTRACSELESLLSTPTDPDWAFEATRDRERAREMLKTRSVPPAVTGVPIADCGLRNVD